MMGVKTRPIEGCQQALLLAWWLLQSEFHKQLLHVQVYQCALAQLVPPPVINSRWRVRLWVQRLIGCMCNLPFTNQKKKKKKCFHMFVFLWGF